jgi:hypothetical protein
LPRSTNCIAQAPVIALVKRGKLSHRRPGRQVAGAETLLEDDAIRRCRRRGHAREIPALRCLAKWGRNAVGVDHGSLPVSWPGFGCVSLDCPRWITRDSPRIGHTGRQSGFVIERSS